MAGLVARPEAKLDPVTIADAIWLAATTAGTEGTVRPPGGSVSAPAGTGSERDEDEPMVPPTADAEDGDEAEQAGDRLEATPPAEPEPDSALDEQSSETDDVTTAWPPIGRGGPRSGPSVRRASQPKATTEILARYRAFRPFRRRVRSSLRSELDVEATIRSTVDLNVVIPVRRPRSERWHSLHLVVDPGPSMQLWHDEIDELARSARHSGAFRRVTVNTGPALAGAAPTSRSVVVVVADAIDPAWYENARWRQLEEFAARAPTAILNPLPVKLWAGTALGPAPVRVTPKAGNPPTERLSALPTRPLTSSHSGIPVIEFDSSSIDHWARASMTGTSTLTAVPISDPSRIPRPPPVDLEPEQIVKRFRATASPAAWRLANVTSTIEATSLDVIRAIQERLLPQSSAQDLAEFVVSGLLRPGSGGGDSQVEFRTACRDALHTLADYNMEDVTAGLLAVSANVQDRFGIPHRQFEVLVGNPDRLADAPGDLADLAEFAAQALSLVKANTGPPSRTPPRPTDPKATLSAELVLAGHRGVVSGVAFAPSADGLLLASAGIDGTVRQWDVGTGQDRGTIQGLAGSIRGVDLVGLDDGILVAAASADGTVQLWETTETGQPFGGIPGHTGPVAQVGMTTFGDDLVVASVGHDGTVRVWGTSEAARVLGTTACRLFGVAVVEHNEALVVAAAGADGVVRLWSTGPDRLLGDLDGHAGPASDVALLAAEDDRLIVASGSHDGTVRLWDAENGRQLSVLEGHDGPVTGVALAATGTGHVLVVSGSLDATVRLWDSESGRELRVLEGDDGPVAGVALAADDSGLRIASGSKDGTVRLWSLAGMW